MLPDPRRYAAHRAFRTSTLSAQAERAGGSHALAADAPQPPDSRALAARAASHASLPDLAIALRALAAEGRDAEIHAALAAAPSAAVYGRLWRALCAGVERPASDEVATRVFAIPWIIVCAGSTPGTIPCVLPDTAALARVFEQHGALGPSRSVGWSHVLCALGPLEALAPSELLRGWESPALREAAPAPIAVLRGVEEVHLRFLLGAAVSPSHAPDVSETGANIGGWGTPALKAMAAQLATPGVQVLPMPRPPAGVYTATTLGRKAAVETAFNLFVSNAVRRFRRTVGDPNVTLSAHEGGEIRVSLWTPLDDGLTEGFRWPLHAADDLEEIVRTIGDMVAECRLPEPHRASEILPDRSSTGAVLYPARVD
jgi:hypothetical protein